MKCIHCQIKVIDSKEVNNFAKKHCQRGWVYAFVKYPDSKIILCEVYLVNKQGSYCPASEDIVDKRIFDKVKKKENDFYNKMTWEQYRSNIFRDLLFPIKMECK